MVSKEKFAEQEKALGYRLTLVGRNIHVTDTIRQHVFDQLSKIDRFHNHVMDLHVTLEIQKLEHSCVIILKFDHFKVKVASSSTDMYASIDKAVEKLRSKIRRWKSRIQEHHNKPISLIDMHVNILGRPYDEVAEINAEIEEEAKDELLDEYRPSRVIGNDKRPLKILTTDEAVMKMELSGDQFLIFRGEDDRKLKVIYRRSDGNYGIILPE